LRQSTDAHRAHPRDGVGQTVNDSTSAVLEPGALVALVEVLQGRGYRVVGPQVRERAVIYDDLASADDLPVGWGDEQAPGTYRLRRREDEARFGFASSPHSWKQFLFPAHVRLWTARRDGDELELTEEPPPERPLALVGVRGCDLQAIRVQDRVFLEGPHVDRDYAARRSGLFVVAVNCTAPAATCFCTSSGTGPEAGEGADLVLTEILEPEHLFLAEPRSKAGAEVLAELPSRPARDDDRAAARAELRAAAAKMERAVDRDGLPDLLAARLDSPRWQAISERCLACANCTLVCPTCFCASVEDATDLTGETAERSRSWASCFGLDHSYIHGGPIRASGSARYRQWLTHKFGTWEAQFGVSGCVGCGRCIAWCPVGIDVTEELALLREEEEVVHADG
jgi:ferredoxin